MLYTTLITALTALTAISAIPLNSQEKRQSRDRERVSRPDADDQPLFLLEIHPANRTDLVRHIPLNQSFFRPAVVLTPLVIQCLGLTSIIATGPQVNSSLAITSCNATTPNNETAIYKSWILEESDDADEDPNYGFIIRLNGTNLCVDNREFIFQLQHLEH